MPGISAGFESLPSIPNDKKVTYSDILWWSTEGEFDYMVASIVENRGAAAKARRQMKKERIPFIFYVIVTKDAIFKIGHPAFSAIMHKAALEGAKDVTVKRQMSEPAAKIISSHIKKMEDAQNVH